MKRETKILKDKALASFVVATEAFNSMHDLGRQSRVLLHLQHAFEMLLKAALVQVKVSVYNDRKRRSLGFEGCLRKAREHAEIKLSEGDVGLLRAIAAMRDDEQHWYATVSEQILYLHVRGAVTLFDDLLDRVFKDRLSGHIPDRILPISTDPPRDIALLLDEEYSQITELLRPGRRAGHEARARLRTLVAMQAHVAPEALEEGKSVERMAHEIRQGRSRAEVLPQLDRIATSIDGGGVNVTVHFSKKSGAPVRYISDGSEPAAAIRLMDFRKKYHLPASTLAVRLGLSVPRSKALRDHLGIDREEACAHEFRFGSQVHLRYSDNALNRMKRSLEEIDMDAVWRGHRSGRRVPGLGWCAEAGCVGAVPGKGDSGP